MSTAPGWSFGSAAVVSTSPEGRLLLALRQCATHPAGPLRAVADLVEARRRGELDDDALRRVRDSARRLVDEGAMPEDRRQTASAFLDAVFGDGLRVTCDA